MHKVYAVKCSNYEQAGERMAELLTMMGGTGRFVAPGERIVLKVNLLLSAEPERAVTTHPAIVAAVARLTLGEGAQSTIADSPGSGYAYDNRTLKRVYRASGMDQVAQETGADLNFDTTYRPVSFRDGRLVKHFDIITPLVEADGVLNLCKLKTHTYMGMTGAVKNSFGAIPGRAKPGYHAKLADQAHFAQMLLDLSDCVGPRLSIMDAVVGMEGDGPNNGTPRPIGLLLASENPLALDVVAGEVIGLPRESNPLLLEAEKAGLAPTRIEEVEVAGVDVAALRIPDFKLPATGAGMGLHNATWWQRALVPLFRDGLTLQPRVLPDICIACGACREACPVGAISMGRNGREYAEIDKRDCIRCYCCHEMCPRDAIELHPSLLYRVLMR